MYLYDTCECTLSYKLLGSGTSKGFAVGAMTVDARLVHLLSHRFLRGLFTSSDRVGFGGATKLQQQKHKQQPSMALMMRSRRAHTLQLLSPPYLYSNAFPHC
jgi:hypothetical protein